MEHEDPWMVLRDELHSQGLMFAEMCVERIAKVVGRPDHLIRELNMYQEGDTTHFGQVSKSVCVWEGGGRYTHAFRSTAFLHI
jgi:CO/xanthine dehydrogenase Mo-binding subunit